jgi:hypothetical protein
MAYNKYDPVALALQRTRRFKKPKLVCAPPCGDRVYDRWMDDNTQSLEWLEWHTQKQT